MAIQIKTAADIDGIRKSSRIAANCLVHVEPFLRPGITTEEIDKMVFDFFKENGAVPSTLNYKGYPKSCCISINEIVCHGIPDKQKLKEGDIVNVDVTAYFGGYHGDTSKTFNIGKVSRAARDLVSAAEEAMWFGIRAIRPNGGHFGDIGEAIQKYAEGLGYSIVREYCGHGIGKEFHEDPHVVHYGRKGSGPEIKSGMVFTVEPMVNQGKKEIVLLDDDWTVETKDRKLSAQFEHTVAVLPDGVEILTLPDSTKLSRVLKF